MQFQWLFQCHSGSVVIQEMTEKIWAIPLVQITLSKKQQDTGDSFASVVLEACQWRLKNLNISNLHRYVVAREMHTA